MNARVLSRQVVLKGFLALLVVLVSFQMFGMTGIAASIISTSHLQNGGSSQPLQCSSSLTSNCDIQIVLLIDDSGSMRTNDPGFSRNEGAKNLVDILDRQYYAPAELLNVDDPEYHVPDVKIAVVHFTNEVVNSPEWITFGESNDWKSQLETQIDSVKNDKNFYRNRVRETSFIAPFGKAKDLFALDKTPAAEGGCIRRSIMLFTDGTPESKLGIPASGDIKAHMEQVSSIVKALQDSLSEQEKVGIFVTGFKTQSNYWDSVKNYWTDIAGYASPSFPGKTPKHVDQKSVTVDLPVRMEEITAYLSDIQRTALTSNTVQIPAHARSVRFTLYNPDKTAKLTITDPNNNVIQPGEHVTVRGQDKLIEVWQLEMPAAGKYTVVSSKQGGTITELIKYQDLTAQFSGDLGPFQLGQKSNIAFRLLDEAGQAVLPGDDFASASLKLNFSITPDGAQEKKAAVWKQDGDVFQVSWTPVSMGDYQLGIDANLLSAQGNALLNCSGNWPLTVPSGPVSSTIVNVVVGPNDDVKNNSVTVHVKMRYLDTDASPRPVNWKNSAVVTEPSGNRNLTVSNTTVDETQGLYDITISPVDNARKINTTLIASTSINGSDTQILNTLYLINIRQDSCGYQGPWLVWFWPLVLLLALALIVLLLFRYRKERDIETDREDTSRSRVRYWNLLFVPFAILLLLAILNKVWWCYVIPLWMFLVVFLVLILITLPIRLLPWETRRGASSWWLVAMLVLAGLLLVASLIFKASLLWILLAIVSILIVRWAIYHILFYVPERPMILGFVKLPPCVPAGEKITLPLELTGEENLGWASTLTWEVLVTTEPPTHEIPAKLVTVDADRGEYQLEIDPVNQADCINVVIKATTKSDRHDFHTSSLITSIEICDADDLKDLEGIGEGVEKLLHKHGIYTFKKLADTDWLEIEKWLDGEPWGKMMNPKTWPQQARLREAAKSNGLEKDWVSYFDYKDWLFDGIEADEYARPEDKVNRRPDVLLWPKERNRISDEEWDAAEERFSQRVKQGLTKARARKKASADEK